MNGENVLRVGQTEQKRPEVTMQVERLQAVGKMLDENLAMLEDRLKPVTAERKAEGSGASNSPEPVRVPLAEELRGVEQNFRRMVDRVASITSRLEI